MLLQINIFQQQNKTSLKHSRNTHEPSTKYNGNTFENSLRNHQNFLEMLLKFLEEHLQTFFESTLRLAWNILKLFKAFEAVLKYPCNFFKARLKHSWNIHETPIKNILELTLKQTWNIIEALKPLFNFLEISLKHSWSAAKTWLNHLWNFLEIPFQLLWNTLHTPSKRSSIFPVTLSKLSWNDFLQNFLKHPWNIFEPP